MHRPQFEYRSASPPLCPFSKKRGEEKHNCRGYNRIPRGRTFLPFSKTNPKGYQMQIGGLLPYFYQSYQYISIIANSLTTISNENSFLIKKTLWACWGPSILDRRCNVFSLYIMQRFYFPTSDPFCREIWPVFPVRPQSGGIGCLEDRWHFPELCRSSIPPHSPRSLPLRPGCRRA